MSSLGVPGVPWHTQILADQLTPFQLGGTDYANLITTGTPGFSDLSTALNIELFSAAHIYACFRKWSIKKCLYKHRNSVPLNHSLVAIVRVTFFFDQCWRRLASFFGNFLLSKSRLHDSINSFSVDSDHPEENQTWRIDLDLAWFKIIWYRTLHLTIETIEESTPTIE